MSTAKDWMSKLIEIIRDQMHIDVADDQVHADTLLGEGGLNLDSIKFIELTVRLEQDFQISVPDESLHKIGGYSISQFINEYMDKRVS